MLRNKAAFRVRRMIRERRVNLHLVEWIHVEQRVYTEAFNTVRRAYVSRSFRA
jgi:nitrate reductase assembly molybdenum cofactor insertion protein NarJ